MNAILRSVTRDLRTGQAGRYRLHVAPEMIDTLALGTTGQQILERVMGMAPELAADETLSRADYRLEKL